MRLIMYMSVKEQKQDEYNRFKVRRVIHTNSEFKHSWHTWYAWRPVRLTITGRWVWMRKIYRRALYKTYATYDEWQQYEYGTILDVLGSDIKPPYQGRTR